jgi:hypothetical protein
MEISKNEMEMYLILNDWQRVSSNKALWTTATDTKWFTYRKAFLFQRNIDAGLDGFENWKIYNDD